MTGADQDVRASFAPQEGLIYTGNICPHCLAYVKESGSCEIGAYVLDQQFGARDQKPAAIKYAADEMSPGTKICCPYNSSQA